MVFIKGVIILDINIEFQINIDCINKDILNDKLLDFCVLLISLLLSPR